ncbi:unnamed protein product [Prunus armeniaca]|uniref:Uncharacterized protein n=1 Tax=Prunus armeniaca TaxID=36596 RepID=A0A6J5V5V9_PRUAR|nr:unnamed protein product [Prunus armeniaca]
MQDTDAIIKNLQEDLKGKRYLLVLDDVWNEDSEKWNDLMSCLLSVKDTQGSNILVTTRSARVASISQTLSRYDLQKLSDDQCWLILKDRAFPNESDPTLNEDEERIGRDIAKKCGGIPLVAKVLGSMMQFKEIDGWRVIQESTIWDLPEEEKRISSVLKLSFDELTSPTLKQCFVYCSMFTKDFEIEKDDLIQLWMAQGLLHPSPNNSDLEMEDVGNQYFNILLENSFFQDVRMDYYYGTIIATCKIHDLVHDLAEDVSKSKTKGSNEIRHVPQNSTIDLQEIPKGIVHKRSLIFDELPNSIGKLKHLRYPVGMGRLKNLRSLSFFIVGKEGGRGIKELGGLKHLKGELSISDLKHVRDGEEAKEAKLAEKTNIRRLELEWSQTKTGQGSSIMTGILTVENAKNLTEWTEEAAKLEIDSMNSGMPIANIISTQLTTLTRLTIKKIRGLVSLPEGMLKNNKNLAYLEIRDCPEFICIAADVYGCCASLESLRIYSCPNLRSLPHGLEHCTFLKELTIAHCESLECIPVTNGLPSLCELYISNCDELSSLPSGLQHCTSLEHLSIYSCRNLEAIPITHGLPSLRN